MRVPSSHSVDPRLRAYIDAAGNCKDREAFYNTLNALGPEKAYEVYSQRVGINPIWLPTIRQILGLTEKE